MGDDRAVGLARVWDMNVPTMKYARRVVLNGDMSSSLKRD